MGVYKWGMVDGSLLYLEKETLQWTQMSCVVVQATTILELKSQSFQGMKYLIKYNPLSSWGD